METVRAEGWRDHCGGKTVRVLRDLDSRCVPPERTRCEQHRPRGRHEAEGAHETAGHTTTVHSGIRRSPAGLLRPAMPSLPSVPQWVTVDYVWLPIGTRLILHLGRRCVWQATDLASVHVQFASDQPMNQRARYLPSLPVKSHPAPQKCRTGRGHRPVQKGHRRRTRSSACRFAGGPAQEGPSAGLGLAVAGRRSSREESGDQRICYPSAIALGAPSSLEYEQLEQFCRVVGPEYVSGFVCGDAGAEMALVM